MSVINNYRSHGPELPGWKEDSWRTISLPRTEEKLREHLDELYGSDERQEEPIRRVEQQLECCRYIGTLAGVPLPTPIMAEAEGAVAARLSRETTTE